MPGKFDTIFKLLKKNPGAHTGPKGGNNMGTEGLERYLANDPKLGPIYRETEEIWANWDHYNPGVKRPLWTDYLEKRIPLDSINKGTPSAGAPSGGGNPGPKMSPEEMLEASRRAMSEQGLVWDSGSGSYVRPGE